tara:strand:+ start:338 stop:490 length:153 start_codon:yes stop_codon:yes gene_type:complete
MNEALFNEVTFNNISSSYNIGYTQVTAILEDISDKNSKDHRSYVLGYSEV